MSRETERQEIIDLTPELALRLLENNRGNRSMSKRKVADYQRLIEMGRWKYNGETIKVHSSGRLLDGQQRCLAVAQSGKTIRTGIAYVNGNAKDVFRTIDVGKKRSAADHLTALGYPNAFCLAATAAWVYRYAAGNPGLEVRYAATNEDVEAIVQRFPEMGDSVSAMYGRWKEARYFAITSFCGFAHWLFSQANPKKADEFFNGLTTGENLVAGSALLLLIRSLRRARSKSRRDAVSNVWVAAVTIKAWNAFITGREIRRLSWNSEEGFPRALDVKGKEIIYSLGRKVSTT
jgi:hypothetical protein